MTDTPNLGLPYIDGSQAQKHVTHNEALRILDAAIQIGVLDMTLATPPSSPAEGERHVVASGATGAWAGQDDAIATWQDGAWAFLAPKTGWCIWSAADSSLFVFDGAAWQGAGGTASLDNVAHLGVNMAASSPNLLAVTSNAALFAAIDAADGGTGDMRVQLSKEGSANTASVFFSDQFSGRAEFGLVGADTFKLKVSADGSGWTEAFNIDQDTGNLTLARGLSLTGVISPAQITADQDDYNPADLVAASVVQISADAPRDISGLAGGAEGRCLTVINVGSQPVTLLNESTSSSASNRLSLGGSLTIPAKRAAILRYDGTAARWQAIAGGAGTSGGGDLLSTNNLSDVASAAASRSNLAAVGKVVVQKFTASGTYTPTSGMLYAIIEVVGGGGGGGGVTGSVTQSYSGGGGGSGAYSRKIVTAADIGASKAVTVGTGGAGGTAGSNNGSSGNSSGVGSLVGAAGGAGGKYGSSAQIPAGGAGGSAGSGTGDLTSSGTPGGMGSYIVATVVVATGGNGGGSYFGGGGLGGTGTSASNGSAASNYGSGGGGAQVHNLSSTAAGGAGSDGVVIITEFCS